MRHARALPIALALIVAIVAAGCGGGGGISGGVTDAGPGARGAPAARTTKTTGRPTPSPGRRGPSPAPCGDARFGVHKVFPGTAAAGTAYTRYVVTNLSRHACRVSGYPRIVALGADGRPAKTSAYLPRTGPEGTRTVTIARNGTASFMVESSDTDPLGQVEGCRPRAVSGDRILLPGSRRAETMPSVVDKVCAGGAGVAVGPIEVDPSRE